MRLSESALFTVATLFGAVWVQQVVSGQIVPTWLPVVTIGLIAIAAIHSVWLRRTASYYQQWKGLASEFLQIAQSDQPWPAPGKEKTYATLHSGEGVKFGGGVKDQNAPLCDSLSRTAGKLLKWSKARPVKQWRSKDPRGIWIYFTVNHVQINKTDWATQHVHHKHLGVADQYLHVDVFPYAAYLACEHCASLEPPPKQ